jgi:putative peptidoglycan lipid II flippase
VADDGTPGAVETPEAAPDDSRIVRSSAVMAAGTAASRLTGFVRLWATLFALGSTSRLTDTYTVANTTPNIVYELLLGGVLSATLVPVFVKHLEDDDEEGTSAVVTVASVFLVVLAAIGMVAAPWILRLFTLNVEADVAAEQQQVGTALLRLFMPQMLFYGLTAMGTALLHARRRFAAPAFVPALNNILVSAMLLSLTRIAGHTPTLEDVRDDRVLLWTLGLGTTAGIVAMTIALWPFVRRAGIRIRFVFDLRNAAVREVGRLSGWTIGYVVTNQVALLVVLVLAGREAGGVTSYTAAFVFFQLPHALVAVSLMSALVPEMSSAYNRSDRQAFKSRFSLGIRLITLIVMPAATGYVVLSQPITTGLLQYGATEDPSLVADCLAMFAIGLPGFSVYLFTLRGFYARRNTKTPFFLNVFENGLNIVLALVLMPVMGVPGLALAYGLAYTVAAVVAMLTLRRHAGLLDARRLLRAMVKIGTACALMAGAVWLVAYRVGSNDETVGAILRTGVGVVVGATAFLAAVLLLRAEEVSALRARLGRRPA